MNSEKTSVNCYAHGARYYDPQLARWHCSDPLSELYASSSPYGYVINNPINFVDPDGMRRDPAPYARDNYTSLLSDGYNRTPFENSFAWGREVGGWSYNSNTGRYENSFSGETKTSNDFDVLDHLSNFPVLFGTVGNEMAQDLFAVLADPSILVGLETMNDKDYFVSFNLETLDFTSLMSLTLSTFYKNGGDRSVMNMTLGAFTAESAYTQFIYDELNYRTKRGKLKRVYTNKGIVRSDHAKRKVKLTKTLRGVSDAGTAIAAGYSWYQIGQGDHSFLTVSDALIYSAGTINSLAGYYSGTQIPGVGAFVAFYGTCRLVTDVFYDLGNEYGPTTWFGRDDSRLFK